MTLLQLFIGMVIFWSIVLTLIFRFEKRIVWPYGELESSPHYGDPSGYGTQWVSDAIASGFTLLGWARDVRGGTYKASYAMLVSHERDILAVVGIGTILNIPVAATCLHTATLDGRCFYSAEKQSAIQIDLTRNWINQLVPATSLQHLLQEHRDWIRTSEVLSRPFTCGRELAEFRAMREERFRSMERAGLIGFTDPSAGHFRFTLFGAAKTATWGYFLGMSRHISHGRFPRNA